jgi:hypothetical protein
MTRVLRHGAVATLVATIALLIVSAAAHASVVWLCHPGMAHDPCEIPLVTTVENLGGGSHVQTTARAPESKRAVDCFYLYPTVSNQLTINATDVVDPVETSIAQWQAASFSSVCRVYAPIYRQVTASGLFGAEFIPVSLDPYAPMAIAYSDVLAAWKQYLTQDNHGRPQPHPAATARRGVHRRRASDRPHRQNHRRRLPANPNLYQARTVRLCDCLLQLPS